MDRKSVELARAVVNVLGDCPWESAALARGIVALADGGTIEDAARVVYDSGPQTLTRSIELLQRASREGFEVLLTPRTRTGSAANPITKMFPATLTEQRFLEQLDQLRIERPLLDYVDDRETRHSLTDFTLKENDIELPINIKNAGTRFNNAATLVGLAPDDCIPIPAYKAHGAIEKSPSLLYIVAPDYELVSRLEQVLSTLFTPDETQVWRLLTHGAGSNVRRAEDDFVRAIVRRHWQQLRVLSQVEFYVISAKKAIRILQNKPRRTPGIGLRAWGTGASAEVNVHVSIQEDMTPWSEVKTRILAEGVPGIVTAVNRKKQEWVDDPEI